MTTEFRTKQPGEKWPISFNFTEALGTATIASVTSIIALDEFDNSNVSTTVLDSALQTNTDKIVYAYVQGGTSGHRYLITCKVAGSDGNSTHELEGILPVQETPVTTTGGTRCVVQPTVEPVTLSEAKIALGLDSGTMATDSTMYSCIAAGSHLVVTGYALLGTAVEVLGKTAVVYLQPVNNGTGATVDCKIQECDTTSGTWTDWSGGAFTQVTEANDTTIQEIAYTGTKKYIRTAAKTLVQACEFGTSVMVWEPNVLEDDLIAEYITTARMDVENDMSRKIITQTWDYCPKRWPSSDRIKLPFGNLQSVTSVSYKDSAGTETTLTAGTDYIVEQNGDQCGFVVLPYQGSWPSASLYVSNPIRIRFICGYGLASSVPSQIKQAIKRRVINLYMNKGDDTFGSNQMFEDKSYARLLNNSGRLYDMDFDFV